MPEPMTPALTMPVETVPVETMMAAAAGPTIAVVRAITDDQLGAPTPCAEFDVRKLINHLLFWGPALAGAARKEAVAPPAASERDVDLTEGDWAGRLVAQTEQLAAAWSHPEAWQGTTRLGSPDDLPAPMIGSMVLGELVVHGWDLARATGQAPRWDENLLRFLLREVAQTAEQGRQMGVYGEQVPVPETAPVLDQILALTGRNPR